MHDSCTILWPIAGDRYAVKPAGPPPCDKFVLSAYIPVRLDCGERLSESGKVAGCGGLCEARPPAYRQCLQFGMGAAAFA